MIKISIDEAKCTRPPVCTACLLACPQGVLWNYPRRKRTLEERASDWVVVPAAMTLCTGCGICAEACPQKAVTVSTAA